MGEAVLERRTLHTTAVERAREEIGKVFCPHRLQPGPEGVDVRFSAHRSDGVAVVGLDYGHRVRITPGRLEDFYLVMVPLAGRALIDHGDDHFVSTPANAAILSPTEGVDMHWGERNPQLLCWLERSAVEQELALLADRELDEPLRFRAQLPLEDSAVRTWLGSVRRLWQQLGDPAAARPRRWERTVLTSLLITRDRRTRPTGPHSARRPRPAGTQVDAGRTGSSRRPVLRRTPRKALVR